MYTKEKITFQVPLAIIRVEIFVNILDTYTVVY